MTGRRDTTSCGPGARDPRVVVRGSPPKSLPRRSIVRVSSSNRLKAMRCCAVKPPLPPSRGVGGSDTAGVMATSEVVVRLALLADALAGSSSRSPSSKGCRRDGRRREGPATVRVIGPSVMGAPAPVVWPSRTDATRRNVLPENVADHAGDAALMLLEDCDTRCTAGQGASPGRRVRHTKASDQPPVPPTRDNHLAPETWRRRARSAASSPQRGETTHWKARSGLHGVDSAPDKVCTS